MKLFSRPALSHNNVSKFYIGYKQMNLKKRLCSCAWYPYYLAHTCYDYLKWFRRCISHLHGIFAIALCALYPWQHERVASGRTRLCWGIVHRHQDWQGGSAPLKHDHRSAVRPTGPAHVHTESVTNILDCDNDECDAQLSLSVCPGRYSWDCYVVAQVPLTTPAIHM